jgi:hypothetical protein
MDKEKLDTLATKFTEVFNIGFDLCEQNMITKIFRGLIKIKCSLDPHWLINEGGPFFFKYKEHVANKNIKFFTEEHDYESQKDNWCLIFGGHGRSQADAFAESLKKSLKIVYDNHPEDLKRCATALLKIYIDYLILVKGSNP